MRSGVLDSDALDFFLRCRSFWKNKRKTFVPHIISIDPKKFVFDTRKVSASIEHAPTLGRGRSSVFVFLNNYVPNKSGNVPKRHARAIKDRGGVDRFGFQERPIAEALVQGSAPKEHAVRFANI